MLNLREALEYCGFEDVTNRGDSPFADSQLWEGSDLYQDLIGVSVGWIGWDPRGVSATFWRTYGNQDFDEVVIYCDRVVIIDRTSKRVATTCRCEPEGCALAAELVRAWFTTGR